VAKLAATQFGSDGGGVAIEEAEDAGDGFINGLAKDRRNRWMRESLEEGVNQRWIRIAVAAGTV
jgi:hypothetical protein